MKGTCQQPGCERVEHCRGLCNTHYWRMRHGKDMDAPIRRQIAHDADLAERLYARLDMSGGPESCWPWTGHRRTRRNRGLEYARMGVGGDTTDYVHRVSYMVHIGPIPDGMLVCHRCDNPPCGNPAHLFLGTTQDNTADKVAKGRQLRGQHHPGAKLTADDVVEIRSTPGVEGFAVRAELADRFGVTRATIRNIAWRRSWRSLS